MKGSKALMLATMIIGIPALSGAYCGPSLVYMYVTADGWELDCGGDLVPGSPLIVHVLLESWDFPFPIHELSFRVQNWIGNPGEPLGQVTEHWTADSASGSLEDGITLVWQNGLTPFWSSDLYGARRYDLGYLEIEAFSPDWVGTGHVVECSEATYTDVEGWAYEGGGESMFTFNDGGYAPCIDFNWDPSETIGVARHFVPEDGAVVPPVFPLEFQVICWACFAGGGRPFAGTVYLEGEPIAEFSGEGIEEFTIPVDASAYPPLDTIQVRVSIEYFGSFTYHTWLFYVISDETPAPSTHISGLKALYR